MRAATACPAGRLLQWRVIGCIWAGMQGLGEKSLALLTNGLKPDLGRVVYPGQRGQGPEDEDNPIAAQFGLLVRAAEPHGAGPDRHGCDRLSALSARSL